MTIFGKNYESIPVISYAASFGHTKLEKLRALKIDKEIAELLNNFKAISVRDENSFNIIKQLTRIEPVIHLDPVLIASYDSFITNKV